ncbi:MAG: carbon-nitrogen hydrolase family protein [Candidatus Dormiibacterota bacterium]
MKVAVAQYEAGSDKNANLEHITELAEQAASAGARLVVFPEGAMHTFGELNDDLRPSAELLDGPFVDHLSRLASRLNQTLVAGMFELIPGDERIYNTAVVIDPSSGLAAAHRKGHLYDAFGENESDRFRPNPLPAGERDLHAEGDHPMVRVDGFTIAIAICYELRFPTFIQQLADRGADLLVAPSAWVAGPLKEEHWNVMVRARAIENTMYVAAVGMTGAGYCARSMIVDPMGAVIGGLGETEGVAVADLSKERLARVRAKLPLVAQRRAASGVRV